ncbi:MAG: glutamate synthase-related protein [Alphaproteobacteria bacterium]
MVDVRNPLEGNPDNLKRANVIETIIGQGAEPAGGGPPAGEKIDERVADMGDLPEGVVQRNA